MSHAAMELHVCETTNTLVTSSASACRHMLARPGQPFVLFDMALLAALQLASDLRPVCKDTLFVT